MAVIFAESETSIEAFDSFAAGTLILTDRGTIPVEALRLGDRVATRDRGYQPVRWIGRRKLNTQTLASNANWRPIRIQAGALGCGAPLEDLLVSPLHRILLRSKFAGRQFGSEEVLVAAKFLSCIERVDTAENLHEVEYVQFLCDHHEVVMSNGAWTGSMYPGPETLKSLEKDALEEIFAIFPELRNQSAEMRPKTARMLLTGRQGHDLVRHHANNNHPLLATGQN